MTGREERGLAIAAKGGITQSGDSWLVPSATHDKKTYVVRLNPDRSYCSCPDHDALGVKCKHIFAVEIVRQRTLFADGSETITQTVTVTETVKKQSKQDWPAYNAAQTNEKDKFQSLLADLCRNLKTPPSSPKGGRPRLPLADLVFAMCFKVYSTFSGRRFMSDMRAAHKAGYVGQPVHYNCIARAMEDPTLFDTLRDLILESSLPLKTVETTFAVDSTGLSASRFVRWFSIKHEKEVTNRDWVKLHLCCGTKTNIVTAVEIHERDANDSPQFFPLVETTAQNFKIGEVSADKAYSSRANLEAVEFHGGTAYIPFKVNAKGTGGLLWQKMFHYFCFRQDEFLQHYHRRSNVESTFSMIKAKFGDHVRSKSDAAMKNEVLCKVVCHNICVLIQEMYELGIEPTFWGEKPDQPALPAILKFPG